MPIEGRKRVEQGFTRKLEKMLQNARKAALETLDYVGLECVKEARQNGRYKDQTGNLRSSIGYVVLDNGKIVKKSGFQKVKTKAIKAKGEAEKSLNAIINDYQSGLVLIVVAGMNYATYVEARGYNVLNSSEVLAKKLVPQMLKELDLI